jgi:hypothetical protein
MPWVLAGLGVLLLAAAIAGIVLTAGGGSPGGSTSTGTSGGPVKLTGAGTWDPPPGDGREHDDEVGRATDGDAASYWSTEHYRTFSKPGVGLVLAARRPVALKGLTIVTDTPGFTAEIQSGASPSGPFETVSPSQTVGGRTTFTVDTDPARFYVVWITNPGAAGVAHVDEVTARG